MYARYDPLRDGDPQLGARDQANVRSRFNAAGDTSRVSVIDRDQ
jgi:hypothetical protein